MIEIITRKVKMPAIRRYQRKRIKNKWNVIDAKTNIIRYTGSWEDVCIACFSLNKKYYENMEVK